MQTNPELSLLAYHPSELPESVQLQGGDGKLYEAILATPNATIAPQYEVLVAGSVITTLTLPSQLPSVELHLLEWLLGYEHRYIQR